MLHDCEKCYNNYRPEANFIANVIDKRRSYMSCWCYESEVRNRVGHRSIPILLGSWIDFLIRGHKAVNQSRAQWGLVILKGLLKIYPNFSTFDSLTMHERETKGVKTIDWFTYVNDDGLALSYYNKTVTWIYKRQKYVNNGWVYVLASANPFGTQIILAEYVQMFDTILEYPYCMNDLKNRQIINAPAAMSKYISYRKKNKNANCQKLATAFENGTLYPAFSKKNVFETEEKCKNYYQAYDNPMHEGRSNKTAHLLPTVVRASNAAVRNSAALSFPSDAIGFYCLLNTKDLKSAGEQNVLADYVIMCEETDQIQLYKHLCSLAISSSNVICTNRAKNTNILNGAGVPVPANELAIMVINGFLINCTLQWNLSVLIDIKKKFPHITTQYNMPYVRFSTRGRIPIKYSDTHDTFFGCAEVTHFRIKFPDFDMVSITAKTLTLDSLIKTPPSKSTVSINNIKGSVATITSNLHHKLMKNSLGVTCHISITDQQFDGLIEKSVMSYNNDTTNFNTLFALLDREFQLNANRDLKVWQTDCRKAMVALDRLYPAEDLLSGCIKMPNTPYVRTNRMHSNISKIEKYRAMIFGKSNFDAPRVWTLKLRCAFGNPHGYCIEDGVVIDQSILEHIPPVYYNACITVDFTFKTVKQPKDAKFVKVDNDCTKFGNTAALSSNADTLIGCLITEHEVYVKHSKHTKILTNKLGEHYYYLILFLPKKTDMYDNIEVRHIHNNNSITVVITGETRAPVYVGSKVANAYGQKNIISNVMDLSGCWGITRTGRQVHAQMVYSEVSLVSRIISGQLYNMFMSDELAIGPDGTIIAPVELVLHTLHPYTNIKLTRVKNDTLTNINGFDAQNLSFTSQTLRTDDTYDRVRQVFGLHGYDLAFSNFSLTPQPRIYTV